MMLRSTVRGLSRAGAFTALVVCLAALCMGTASANAATAPWSPMDAPWGASWAINDVCAFGATGLAAAGDGGHIGITRDGGKSWSVDVPVGLEAAVFTAIAVDTSGRGIVASGGLLLVRDDWGSPWRTPSYSGPVPGAAINDVALRGTLAVAVGDDGVIMSSSDGGSTWRRLASPTVSAITSVAIAGDGTAVAGSAAGEILVGDAEVWTRAASVAGLVTSVAASTDPVWGDGRPDLFAATGGDVLGSDDALTFLSLPGLPDMSSQPWPSLAWPGVPRALPARRRHPERRLLGTGQPALAARPDWAEWHRPGRRSRRPERRLPSRDRRQLGPHDERRSRARHRTARERRHPCRRKHPPDGDGERRRAGHGPPAATRPGRAWETAQTASWASGDWNRSVSFLLKPTLTHEYRLEFKYGEATTELTPATTLVVTPKVSTTRASLKLRRGNVYRFSGSVTPTLSRKRSGCTPTAEGAGDPSASRGP